MPEFLFAYHGGTIPESPEEGEKAMAAWGQWFESMGAAVVNGGNPVGQSMTVTSSGVAGDGGANPVSGYTIVSAETARPPAKWRPAVRWLRMGRDLLRWPR